MVYHIPFTMHPKKMPQYSALGQFFRETDYLFISPQYVATLPAGKTGANDMREPISPSAIASLAIITSSSIPVKAHAPPSAKFPRKRGLELANRMPLSGFSPSSLPFK
jgi:hypothetical protein